VTLVTGFLGSGKTTLLNSLLIHPDMSQAAVIVNEFGEIGLDYDLVERSDESIVQLENGCLCCSVKADLIDTFRDLHLQRQAGTLPKFERVVIETTGIANPGPVLQIILTDPMVSTCYELDGVVTTIDAINGYASLSNFPECVRQVAIADRLVLTKTDLVDGDLMKEEVAKTKEHIRRINPGAVLIESVSGSADPGQLFAFGLKDPKTKLVDLESWLQIGSVENEAGTTSEDRQQPSASPEGSSRDYYSQVGHKPEVHGSHDSNIKSFVLVRDRPVGLETLRLFLEAMTREAGPDLLRVKGIVNIEQRPERPAVIQGAQKVFHSLEWLENWPSDNKQTRIVFITRGITQKHIEDAFDLVERMALRTQQAAPHRDL